MFWGHWPLHKKPGFWPGHVCAALYRPQKPSVWLCVLEASLRSLAANPQSVCPHPLCTSPELPLQVTLTQTLSHQGGRETHGKTSALFYNSICFTQYLENGSRVSHYYRFCFHSVSTLSAPPVIPMADPDPDVGIPIQMWPAYLNFHPSFLPPRFQNLEDVRCRYGIPFAQM